MTVIGGGPSNRRQSPRYSARLASAGIFALSVGPAGDVAPTRPRRSRLGDNRLQLVEPTMVLRERQGCGPSRLRLLNGRARLT